MNLTTFYRFAGWMAFVTAAFTVIGIATLIAFFALIPTLGPMNFMGRINDVSSVVGALVAIPVGVALYLLHHRYAPLPSVLALALAVGADVTLASVQLLFLAGVVDLGVTLVAAPLAFGVGGLGLVVFGLLARAYRTLSPRLALVALVSGGVAVVLVIAGMTTGWDSAVTSGVGLLFVVLRVSWLIAFGRTLLTPGQYVKSST